MEERIQANANTADQTKKEPAPDAANIENGQDGTRGQETANSNASLPQTEDYSKGYISSHLLHGRANAIPGKHLVKTLGLASLRELTQYVEVERAHGAPICASVDSRTPGYYLAADSSEMKGYISSLDRRIKNVELTRQSCANTLQTMEDQEGR